MKVERKKIYDLLLRLSHFGIAFSTLLLIISAYTANYFWEEGLIRKSFWVVHIFSGYAFSLCLVARILWGLVGPEHARWSKLWKWKEWMQFLKSKNFNPPWDWGHHPLAAIAYIVFYFVSVFISLSGLILAGIEHNLGPFAPAFYDHLLYKKDLLEIHETLSLMIIIFIFAHILALYWHEKIDKIPTIQSMFSGFQYKRKKSKEDENENSKNN